MLTPGSHVSLTLEKPVAGGRMLARHDGRVILVAGGIPGEAVEAQIERVARGVAYARVVQVLDADPDRRSVDGDWTCGGRGYAFIAYERQLALKRAIVTDAFARIAHLALPGPLAIAPSPEQGYRMRARWYVRHGQIGFLREGTHEICDAEQTGFVRRETSGIMARLGDVIRRHRLAQIVSAEIGENLEATERVCHLACAGTTLSASDVAALWPIEGLTGLTAGVHAEHAEHDEHDEHGERVVTQLAGSPYAADPIGALTSRASDEASVNLLRRRAQAFFQANRFLVRTVADAVLAHLPEGPVVDLYAGVGLFGCAAAASGWTDVTAVEGDPISAADLEGNASSYPGMTVIHAPVERFFRGHASSAGATFIVDPPRTGISREAVRGLIALNPTRVIYVSCDVATLARDVRHFVDAGYHWRHMEAFDLFPNTAHIECMVVLDRR